MRYDTYATATLAGDVLQFLQRFHHTVQTLLIESTETFVNKEYVYVHVRPVK